MGYFLNTVFIVSFIGGVVSILMGIMFTLKMYGQSKSAPFLLRMTGLSHYMSKYQTKEGISYRNKSFVAVLIFLLFCFLIISVAAKSDPEGWEQLKESYKNLSIDDWERAREKARLKNEN